MNNTGYRDQSLILAVIGVLLLAVGIVAAFLGPVEMYCFYLFSEGGRFHYEGFGFGSFMFGLIASQIIGYYLIAVFLIPLGYGHLKVRRWARPLSLASLWFWLIAGLPLMAAFVVTLVVSKDPSLTTMLIVAPLLGLSYPVIPGVLIWFYRSKNVRLTFETKDPNSYWIERLPVAVLVLCLSYFFYIIVLHVSIFFNGIFPLFDVLMFDLQGIFLADLSIMLLVCLIWGTLKLKAWAWWGSLAYFSFLTFSSVLAFSKNGFSDIYTRMNFAPIEIESFQKIPFQDFRFTALVGIPLFLTLGMIIYSKRHFRTG
jgi:hypothetical protein